MPSSVEQLADGLQQLLQSGIQDAAKRARDVPERLGAIVSDTLDSAGTAGDRLVGIPADLWSKLKQSAEHPDWLSLLILLAVHLRDAIGDPPLKIGVWDPGEGWNRALVLQLTPPAADAELRFSIALGSAGTEGFIVQVRGTPSFVLPAAPLSIKCGASGDGDWRFPLNAAGRGPQAGASLNFEVTLSKDLLDDTGGDVAIGVGRPAVSAILTCGADRSVTWVVAVRFGSPAAAPGVRARLDLRNFLGDLGTVINVTPIDEQYSPSWRLASGAGPKFDLGHRGA